MGGKITDENERRLDNRITMQRKNWDALEAIIDEMNKKPFVKVTRHTVIEELVENFVQEHSKAKKK